MVEKNLEAIVSGLKPTKREILGVAIPATIFWIVCLIAIFGLWGMYSDTSAILSGLFAALWTGQLGEKLRLSRRIQVILDR